MGAGPYAKKSFILDLGGSLVILNYDRGPGPLEIGLGRGKLFIFSEEQPTKWSSDRQADVGNHFGTPWGVQVEPLTLRF